MRQGQPTLWKRVGTDGSYLSASDSRALFGLGATRQIDRVVAEWPDGTKEYWTGMQSDREIVLRRGSGTTERGQ